VILALESSCDDSAASVIDIESGAILFERKIAQNEAHGEFGGVVPELAARLHAENLPKLIESAASYLPRLKAVAVTNAPGLTVSLAEGVAAAQAISLAMRIPLLAINHIKGHVYSLFIDRAATFPLLALMVSGGHTELIAARSYDRMSEVAVTLDDSIGEAFDKAAVMLGRGYPGGAVIENLARDGDENRFEFPLPLKNDKRIAFSFSGLKNSLRLLLERLGETDDQTKRDVAASFQKALFRHLLEKTRLFLSLGSHDAEYFGVVGGVSANRCLRSAFEALAMEFGLKSLFAPLEYCSDNAAMIARAALEAYRAGEFCDPSNVAIVSRISLERR
jgi:N6-L-threonylcarbamoyladenine synthase